MKAFKIIAGLVIAAGAVVAINTATASATQAGKCELKGTGWNPGTTFKENGNTITSTFEVTGSNCTTPVTVAVWKSPANSVATIKDDIYGQTLFSYKTKTFGPGKHSLTTTLPGCFYQADLLESANPKAPDGTAHYGYQNGKILKVHPLRDHKFGGNKKCEKPEEPKDVCPNIDGNQSEIPEGHEKDGKGNCVVPEEPETPEEPKEEPKKPEVKGETTPTKLPETGAGAIAATFAGISASAGVAHNIVSRLKRK